jgi:hypothetical protein
MDEADARARNGWERFDDNKGTNNDKSEGAVLGWAKVEVEKQISPLRRSRYDRERLRSK